MRRACQKFARETRMQRVAGFIGHKPAKHRLANQGKIPQQIESFVTNKLILEPQRGIVQHARLRQDDRVLQRSSTDKAARLQFLNFMVEAERPRRRNQVRVVRSGELDVEALFTDQRMGEINIVPDAERIGRIDAERLLAFVQNEFVGDSNELPCPTLFNDTDSRDSFDIRQCATVKDGDLEVVEFDIGIVDADSIERRQQVFDRRYPHAPTHQRRRIGDSGYRCHISAKLEIVEIDAAKNDSLAGGSRKDSNGRVLARVESDTAEFERICDRLLAHQGEIIATD